MGYLKVDIHNINENARVSNLLAKIRIYLCNDTMDYDGFHETKSSNTLKPLKLHNINFIFHELILTHNGFINIENCQVKLTRKIDCVNYSRVGI